MCNACCLIVGSLIVQVCKVALNDPGDLTIVDFLSSYVKDDIENGRFEYNFQKYKGMPLTVKRLKKYMVKGFILYRIRLDSSVVLKVTDCVMITRKINEPMHNPGDTYVSFLWDLLKNNPQIVPKW